MNDTENMFKSSSRLMQIGLLHIAYNVFSADIVPLICSLLGKVERVNLHNCIKEEGKDGGRNLNASEQQLLQDALNSLQDKVKFAYFNHLFYMQQYTQGRC